MAPVSTEHEDCVAVVAKRYRAQLHAAGIVLQRDPDGSVAPGHLLWMLEMLISDPAMTLTKRHRWLGFIQGCLIKDNVINLQDERNVTRDVFAGD